jgi:hypothetical protein
MEIYKPIVLQVISFLCLLLFLVFSKLKKSSLLKIIFLSLILCLVWAVFINRDYGANIDLPLYMDFYKYNVMFVDIFVSKTAWKGDFLFFGLMPVSHFLGLDKEDYISFQLVISIGLMFLAYYLFFRDTRALLFLALFFMLNSSSFYLTQGNVIRQGFASSLLLLGICAKTPLFTNLFKLMAFFSHKGAVIAFLSPFTKFANKYRIILLALALFLGYFAIFVKVLNLLPLPAFVATKLEFYASFERASSNSLMKLILLLIFNLVFLKFRAKEEFYEKAYSVFFAFSIAALLLFRFDGMFSRLILYTDVFMPIVTVGCIKQFKLQKNRIRAASVFIGLSLLYSIYVFNHDSILFNMGKYFKI